MPLDPHQQESIEAVTSSEVALPTSASVYRALLIRCWREEQAGGWRFMAQDVNTGEQYGFAELDLLLAFLHQQMGEPDGTGHLTPNHEKE